jgi:hypothetical protein
LLGDHTRVPKCILCQKPAILSEITVSNASGLQHFILLITDHYEILRFLITLRHSSLNPNEFRQVLIFAPRPPTELEFSKISRFPEVYIKLGSPRDSKDLEMAGMFLAERVVIMSLSSMTGVADDVEEDLLDSSTM